MDSEYYTAGEKEFLLKIAYKSLEKFLMSGEKFEPQTINKKLWEKRGVFVTLNLDNKLHGCVGHIEPQESLILSVRDNTILAFNDPRSQPFKIGDLDKVEIEISILSELEKVSIDQIKSGDGVLIRRGSNSATYLPNVWSSFKDKQEFLNSLCLKANIDSKPYDDGKIDFWTYKAIFFK
ncbi:AmmeMemoRadiSam system protein A [Candidatus Falkowbacteria bacterium]|uniref:AmmeMemoRadiSam system protein A n=1 Tax=Candidatus Buchananbacteria bacterium CG10_big_fil_rev_8_21_14_0_10_33_19 TaxID=1974525 RepID=A0A2H0W473_9BACT|nr:AmmeMemoRadiSam system protein A [Candidatus Falkowbacteria bacterium]PIS06148.1 MAG: AmmeMemoRadiSam system protein A [Candidatus Buchananbacteria bacterium CG10_big_fil_rev_8_21_14_0_10_33_19]